MGFKPKIAVIGGGISGIGTACAILQSFPHVELRIYSEIFSPYTTSDGAGGLWGPFISPGTSEEKMNKWSLETWNLFDTWWKQGRKEVLLIPVYCVDRKEMSAPFWSQIPFDFRSLEQPELKSFGPDYVSGHSYKAYVAETGIFLPKLMEDVKRMGGSFERRNVRKIDDLGDKADVIINCSGIGAYDLVPDKAIHPIRGQVMRVKCPSINFGVHDESDESFAYVFPNINSVVVGGTHQENDWRTSVDVEDSKRIWENAIRVAPQLKGCELIREWVGLRPARHGGIRVEEEEIRVGSLRSVPVIHNYGHGGSGITTFWGCANEVASMVGKVLHRKYGPTGTHNSKL